MRTIRTIVFTAGALLISASLAALPPHFQRLAELNAVMNHADIAATFGINQPISSVEYLDVDLYRVTGGACHMFVRIVGLPLPEGFVGARQFEVVPGELQCA